MPDIFLPAVLLVVAAALFFAEAFIPSSGMITAMGIACAVAAVWIAFARNPDQPSVGMGFLIASIILLPACLIGAFMLLPKTALGRRLMLHSAQKPEAGYVAQDSKEQELVGQVGEAISNLRPSGEARIGGQRYDVISEGGMIAKGARIRVRTVSGNRIVVRETTAETNEG